MEHLLTWMWVASYMFTQLLDLKFLIHCISRKPRAVTWSIRSETPVAVYSGKPPVSFYGKGASPFTDIGICDMPVNESLFLEARSGSGISYNALFSLGKVLRACWRCLENAFPNGLRGWPWVSESPMSRTFPRSPAGGDRNSGSGIKWVQIPAHPLINHVNLGKWRAQFWFVNW